MRHTEAVKSWIVRQARRAPGDRAGKLPSRHAVMRKFKVARATVDKIYRELASEGVVYSHKGSGTFAVVSTLSMRRLYVVSPYPPRVLQRPSPSEFFETLDTQVDYTYVGTDEVSASLGILSTPSACVVWHCPPVSCFQDIMFLAESKVPQLLVNRQHPDFSYISTDYARRLEELLPVLSARHPARHWGMIAPSLNFGVPFWPERELVIHECAQRYRLGPLHIRREEGSRKIDREKAVASFFDEAELPLTLLLPEMGMLPFVIEHATRGKLRLSDDLIIVSMDHDPAFDALPGIISLAVPWHEMRDEALRWFTAGAGPELRILLPQTMTMPDGHERRPQGSTN